ncbi:MAG: rRNA pseudouridine synthase [Alphaproteobacteria bacterium]|nr:rRNA pseudouridine synthase [Alphaproteobacteria bacterium]
MSRRSRTNSADLAKLFEGDQGAERIAKRMARAGLCSRRDAERWIEDGRVSVNGKLLASPAHNVAPGDTIKVDGKTLAEQDAPRLWRYYKPRGLVVSHRDEKDRDTVFDALPGHLPRVVSVGRLDLDSEGLLLLTNSGDLARYLELPDTGWTRKYRVRVRGRVEAEKLAALADGITVDGVHYRGIMAQLDRQVASNAWLTIALKEGKNREIRKVMEHLGYAVSRLIRVSYGPFSLTSLDEGGVEEVKTAVLRDQLGLPRASGPQKPAGKPAGKSSSPSPSSPSPSSQRETLRHENNQRQKTRRPARRS